MKENKKDDREAGELVILIKHVMKYNQIRSKTTKTLILLFMVICTSNNLLSFVFNDCIFTALVLSL